MCLLCGTIVCMERKNGCCEHLPGMKMNEGELSYHARVVEGGCSAYIIPSTAEIFLVDDGRSCLAESFYRNSLGEEYTRGSNKKWEKFEMSEETGGVEIRATLRKAYLENRLPSIIVQERQKNIEEIIIRNIY